MITSATSEIVFIGLGSNLANPEQQIHTARESIKNLSVTSELGFSSLYSSPPMGPQDQPDYTNAVMQISTSLAPLVLLKQLQAIENTQGRVRVAGQRWGARTLDLDILLYGQQQINSKELSIPHPGLSQRAFVLYPLQEIQPDLIIPGLGDLAELVTKCPLDGLVKSSVLNLHSVT